MLPGLVSPSSVIFMLIGRRRGNRVWSVCLWQGEGNIIRVSVQVYRWNVILSIHPPVHPSSHVDAALPYCTAFVSVLHFTKNTIIKTYTKHCEGLNPLHENEMYPQHISFSAIVKDYGEKPCVSGKVPTNFCVSLCLPEPPQQSRRVQSLRQESQELQLEQTACNYPFKRFLPS